MNSYETAIAERLHDAADRIPVDSDVSDVIEFGYTTVVRRGSTRRRGTLVGVAVVAIAAAAVVAVFLTPDTETRLEAGDASPSGVVDGASTATSESFAAHVVSPPDWFGAPGGAYRTGGFRDGRWVSMAIGRVDADAITQPIAISVFDGSYTPLDDAESVTIDGAPLRSIRLERWPGWQALATNRSPTVLVSGSVDERTLLAVLNAVEVVDPSGNFSLRLRSRPEGYADVVQPRVLGYDAEQRRTLAGDSGHVSINEVSDMTDPLLAAAWS